MPSRLILGRIGFLLVGISILATIWLLFACRREDGRSSLAFEVNLAGLTTGGAVGFFLIAALSRSFFLGQADPEKMSMLVLKWFGISVLIHLATGFMIWRSRQPMVEIDLPLGPDFLEDYDSLADEQKIEFKSTMMEYLETSSAQIASMKKDANRKLMWALTCIGGGAALMGWVVYSQSMGR